MSDTLVPLPGALPPDLALPSVPLTEVTLGALLGALASRPGPVPKYRYPSAGTLYPVQTCVVLRHRLGGLAAGSYYHDPEAHELVALSSAAPAAPDGSTPDALLLLVARDAAIAPIYHAEASKFCLLEAGYMSAALSEAADGVRLRDAGDPALCAALAAACALDADHVPLVCWAVGENG
jgi:hypothetical protein